jgi:hypothetical protein
MNIIKAKPGRIVCDGAYRVICDLRRLAGDRSFALR